jgi:hypothetical protein
MRNKNKMNNKKMSKENIIIIVCAVIAVVLVIGFAMLNKNTQTQNTIPKDVRIEGFENGKTMQQLATLTQCVLPTDKNYDAFAKCLTEKGATMYGAEWCPHCKEQKAVFGNSFKYINYVECPDNTQLCLDKGIQGYPTWIIGTSTIK